VQDQDLLARMMGVEVKAKEVDGKQTDIQAQLKQIQDTSSSVQDLLARMVDVEAKAEEADGKQTEMESRVRVLELEVERLKEELGSEREAGREKEVEIWELTGRIVKMEEESDSGKQEVAGKVKKAEKLKTDMEEILGSVAKEKSQLTEDREAAM
jgi:chromosome segregation ATPase